MGEFAPILNMWYWPEKDAVILVSKTSFLYRYELIGGRMEQQIKIRINPTADGSAVDPLLRAEWIGEGLIGTCTGENKIRLWNLSAGSADYLPIQRGNISPTFIFGQFIQRSHLRLFRITQGERS